MVKREKTNTTIKVSGGKTRFQKPTRQKIAKLKNTESSNTVECEYKSP